MGKSLDQILTEAADGNLIGVTIAASQDDGPTEPLVVYATGTLIYKAPGFHGGQFPSPGSLANDPDTPLAWFFSDNKKIIDTPPGGFGGITQRFNAENPTRLDLSISLLQPHIASFAFFGGVSTFVLEDRENLLIGTGASFGVSADAFYVLSFTGPTQPIPPPN